jgi:ribonuclease Z
VRAAINAAREAAGLTRFESVRVNHCAHAYGLVLEGGTGEAKWTLVFSADTRPCEALVEAAKGSTVFIHEVRGVDEGGVWF